MIVAPVTAKDLQWCYNELRQATISPWATEVQNVHSGQWIRGRGSVGVGDFRWASWRRGLMKEHRLMTTTDFEVVCRCSTRLVASIQNNNNWKDACLICAWGYAT